MPSPALYLVALAAGSASVSAMSLAGLAYRPTANMMSVADANGCDFPGQYRIREFRGRSGAAGSAALTSFIYTFEDPTTAVVTTCRWNTSSASTTAPGLTPRFSCDNRDVKFIWEEDKQYLTSLERFCHDLNGDPSAEVTGTVELFLTCAGNGTCVSNSTDVAGMFTSLGPVIDPVSSD